MGMEKGIGKTIGCNSYAYSAGRNAASSNMQWQTKADAKAEDKWEQT